MSRHARRQRELGAFLRERRGRLRPPTAEDPAAEDPAADGRARRTPGLRREEIADLAGLSVGYYTRLEQGHAAHPSDSVLEALIRTLRLTPDEAAHLKALADGTTPESGDEEVSRSAIRMMTLLTPPTAAVVLGRIGDVLAWNDAARLLFPGRLPAPGERPGVRPNNARYVFCDPSARDLFTDWPEVADDTIAHLRAAAGHLVDDSAYRALVDELLATSPDFAARWSRRDVKRHVSGHKLLTHPTLGSLTLPYEVLAVLDAPDQYLVVYGLENPLSADVEIRGAVSTS